MTSENGRRGDTAKQHKNSEKPWLVPYRFPKGVSGNPKGRPKGSGITDQLRKLVTETDEGKLAEALAKVAIDQALKGDHRFWSMIIERLDGKVVQPIVDAGEIVELGPISLDGGRQL